MENQNGSNQVQGTNANQAPVSGNPWVILIFVFVFIIYIGTAIGLNLTYFMVNAWHLHLTLFWRWSIVIAISILVLFLSRLFTMYVIRTSTLKVYLIFNAIVAVINFACMFLFKDHTFQSIIRMFFYK